jgi:uncharacterized membrane protein
MLKQKDYSFPIADALRKTLKRRALAKITFEEGFTIMGYCCLDLKKYISVHK